MPAPETPASRASRQQLRLLWRITGMAFLMSSEVAAGAGIGWLIDRWQGTGQTWLMVGGIVGIVVGMTSFLTAAFRLSRSGGIPSRPPARRPPADGGGP